MRRCVAYPWRSIEKRDFASGTSSRSSKLIHGGFRYLEQFAFGLVAESCRERRVLQQIAPHRVRPIPFLLPVYEGDPRPLWKMRLGMTLYDLLALNRNTAPHRTLTPKQLLRPSPHLIRQGSTGRSSITIARRMMHGSASTIFSMLLSWAQFA